jgi:hypothetical protein
VAKTEFAPVGAACSRQQRRQRQIQVGFDMPISTGKLRRSLPGTSEVMSALGLGCVKTLLLVIFAQD